MKERKSQVRSKARVVPPPVQKPKRRGPLSRMTRSALLAMSFTATQLSAEADFFGEKFFHRNLVDRLHSTSLTRYHE